MPSVARLSLESTGQSTGHDQPETREARAAPTRFAARLTDAVLRGRRAWPTLILPDDAPFAAHLVRCLSPATATAGGLMDLQIDDLYLACACLEGVPGATAMLERVYRPVVVTYLKRLDQDVEQADEVWQALSTRLLVASATAPAGLAQYLGKGRLAQFIGIAAQRLALNDRRASRARRRLLDHLANEPVTPGRAPDDNLMRRRYRKPFEAALQEAIARLAGRERVVMKLHLVGRVSTTRIAKMYRVNQGTVSRWLQRARQAIWADVESRLHAELGLPPPELQSLLRSVAGELDLSLSAALATEKLPRAGR